MKKFNLSLVVVLAMSTFAIAGGDIAPVEPMIEVQEAPAVDDSGFYVGLGYSYMNMNFEGSVELNSVFAPPVIGETDINGHALTVLAGYNFNKYIAVEGRYSLTLADLNVDNAIGGSDLNADMSNIALYLKPMYPIGAVNIYGLLGYGQVTLDDVTEYTESGFQWGIGASYAVNDNVGVFVDYTKFYDDKGFDGHWITQDIVVDSINVGMTYKF